MKVGAMIFATDETIKMQRLGPELEDRNFESLWIPEKTHLPTSRKTDWPGGDLPEWYKRTSDPLIALSIAAGATTRLRLGTGVSLVPIHDAVILAKAVATLDWSTGGRFDFGIGYGWNAEEFETHGVDLKDARAIMREKMSLMYELWNNDVGTYKGEFAQVEPSWSWPKPDQKPRPPVYIGGRASRSTFKDIAEYCDGWLPIEGWGDIVEQIPKLHRAFEEAGRSREEARISIYSSMGDPELLEKYAEAGVERVILTLPPVEESDVLRALDQYSSTLSEFIGG